MAFKIIGVHGIGNKPAPEVLFRWWHDSIKAGLESIGYSGFSEDESVSPKPLEKYEIYLNVPESA